MVKIRIIIAIAISFLFLFQPVFLANTVKAAGNEVDADYLGTAPGRFNSIQVVDVYNDGNKEIVFGNDVGYIHVIGYKDGAYIDKWTSPELSARAWGVDVADIQGNGYKEILAGDGDGFLYIFNATSHNLIWKSESLGRDVHGIKVGDINGDHKNEIIAGQGYKTDFPGAKVYIFNSTSVFNGNKNPERYLAFNESKHRTVAIADVNGDGKNELIIGSGVALGETPGIGYLRVCDGTTGRVEWKSDDLNGDVEGLAIADLFNDGNREIIVGTGYRYQEGHIFVFKYDNGTYIQIWKSENIGPKAYGLAVGDIDGDGIPEIVSGNEAGYIRVYNGKTFQLKWKSPLLGTDILGIALGDVNSDGQVEIVAAQGGYDGKGDFTSAYTAPHIYIINGKTYEIETTLGEIDWIGLAFQITIIILVIILLLIVKVFVDTRQKITDGGELKRSQK